MANVTITISTKVKTYIESLGGETAKNVLQNVIDAWLDTKIQSNFKTKKSRDEIIDEINK